MSCFYSDDWKHDPIEMNDCIREMDDETRGIQPKDGGSPFGDVAATCTEPGKTEGSHCSVCDTVIKAQENIPATGHTIEVVEAKAATIKAEGIKMHYRCNVCGKLFSDEEFEDRSEIRMKTGRG